MGKCSGGVDALEGYTQLYVLQEGEAVAQDEVGSSDVVDRWSDITA